MNSEHYRLEALKLAVSMKLGGKSDGVTVTELGGLYFNWIMQDKVKAEEEAKQAQLPQYKIPPNQAV